MVTMMLVSAGILVVAAVVMLVVMKGRGKPIPGTETASKPVGPPPEQASSRSSGDLN